MDSQYSFTKIEEMLCYKATQARTPITAAFELTPLCNMNCEMCYIRMDKKAQEQEQRLRTVDEWLSLAVQLKEMGTLFILLTGGEPLLYPDFFELYSELKKMGFILTINTNGTMITEDIAVFFAKNLPRRINVTLYGASNETYERVTKNPKGFAQTMHSLNLLKRYKVPVKMNCSMIRENKDDTSKIIDISEQLEIPLEYNTYMFPCSRRKGHVFDPDVRVTPEEAAEYEIYIKKRQKVDQYNNIKKAVLDKYESDDIEDLFDRSMKCRSGKSSCWFNWKGQMTPCVFFDEPAVDVFASGVKEAWDVICGHCDQVLMPEACTTCRHRHSCSVCAASTRWENGDTAVRPQYLCDYMDEVIRRLKIEESHGRE